MATPEQTMKLAIAIGLLALLPVALYGADQSLSAGILTGINVIIVIAVLILMTRPARRSPGHLAT